MTATDGALHVLALNSGSSSLKYGLYQVDEATAATMLGGEVETHSSGGLLAALREIRGILGKSGLPAPAAIGHRVVHGGPSLRQHSLIDESVLARLELATAFAPLHMPSTLSVIGFAQENFPGIPQAACFDTTFHAGLPDVARILPVPKAWQSEGVQRYGFHGLSIESIVHQLASDLPRRMVVAHLGNGASITAVQDGKSVDTSMGLTPTGGVVMGTRSGDLDPGVLFYLMRKANLDAATVEAMLNRQSGLLGISGVASDMRCLHQQAAGNPAARLAIEMFCYSVRKQIAAMVAVLDGVDLIVFTGGIGEHDAQVRAAACAGLSWMGISLDEARNRSASSPMHHSASRCQIRVLPCREDEQIARHTRALLRASQPASTQALPWIGHHGGANSGH
jgi:acetate kinase